MEFFLLLFIILYSIILHEVAHGFVAYKLGDPTAKYEGRLTLNPLAHIDFFGTIILPIITYLTARIIFGWAKPVPYNPYNLKNPEKDSIYIALAGPAVNLFLVFLFLFLFKIYPLEIFYLSLRINLVLALFNLLPIPPLDGSKLFLSKASLETYSFLETYGFFFLIIFILLFSKHFFAFIQIIQNFLLNSF